jgi:MFS family permease
MIFMDVRPTPPLPFKQPSPDRVEIREGGGCLSIFGVPFLEAGVFTALIGAWIIPISNTDEVPAWAWPLIFLMGLAITPVKVFGRNSLVVFANSREVLPGSNGCWRLKENN